VARAPAAKTAVRTRRAILELLKQEGPADSSALARRVGVSAMAVRQHLYGLRDERLVTYDEEPRPVGRPAKRWRLTRGADRLFADGHAELTVGLLGAMRDAFGEAGLERLLAARTRQQVAAYREKVPARASLRRRLRALAAIRTAEGYMAEVRPLEGGAFALVENHCPVCAAATACTGLCASEIEVFRRVLGEGVTVERDEHILSGARRCVYRISDRRPG
jgi:predicted ArsR family transcriptional regulator